MFLGRALDLKAPTVHLFRPYHARGLLVCQLLAALNNFHPERLHTVVPAIAIRRSEDISYVSDEHAV